MQGCSQRPAGAATNARLAGWGTACWGFSFRLVTLPQRSEGRKQRGYSLNHASHAGDRFLRSRLDGRHDSSIRLAADQDDSMTLIVLQLGPVTDHVAGVV